MCALAAQSKPLMFPLHCVLLNVWLIYFVVVVVCGVGVGCMEKCVYNDTTGQDVYQTANELFFTPHSVVMLVFDMKELLDAPMAMARLRAWCQNISFHTPHSAIVLVGTRGDKVGSQQDQQRISDMLCNRDTGLAGLSAWSKVQRHGSKVFVAVDNTKGPSDGGIVALRRMLLQVMMQSKQRARVCCGVMC